MKRANTWVRSLLKAIPDMNPHFNNARRCRSKHGVTVARGIILSIQLSYPYLNIEDNVSFKCGGGSWCFAKHFMSILEFLKTYRKIKEKKMKKAKIDEKAIYKKPWMKWKPTWALACNKKVSGKVLDLGKIGFLSDCEFFFSFFFIFFFFGELILFRVSSRNPNGH